MASFRLRARPTRVVQHKPAERGLQRLDIGSDRDGWLYVPTSYQPHKPAPVIVALHGAGADGMQSIRLLEKWATSKGAILLGPDSCGRSWDLILGTIGPDVEYIDTALQTVLDKYNVDMERMAISGFSDGASYALFLGLTNGHLFSHILAFSPGFGIPPVRQGSPVVYVSHGVHDRVLNIDRCSRRMVPVLQKLLGEKVVYREFDHGHVVPSTVVEEAMEILTSGLPSTDAAK